MILMAPLIVLVVFAAVIAIGAVAPPAIAGPIRMTERGSSTLVFLERHPRAGTHRSRARLARRSKQRIWRGLRLAGVVRFDYRRGDLDPSVGFGCVHTKEGPWTIHDPPYEGGLQFDSSFAHTYGGEYGRLWGGAGYWPIWAQVNAAYRAWRVRGYTPWPNTARACGLL